MVVFSLSKPQKRSDWKGDNLSLGTPQNSRTKSILIGVFEKGLLLLTSQAEEIAALKMPAILAINTKSVILDLKAHEIEIVLQISTLDLWNGLISSSD